ncbi:MAG TPA: GNAT family N-acetyltransferase [Aquabacterium sp.]|nr:GNAT family N-acetyltransferase [Aquabacterium sp.]
MVPGLTATWHNSLSEIGSGEWDALVAGQRGSSPFLCHAWLDALTGSGCVSPRTGWKPHILVLRDAEQKLVGACLLYLKSHSWGEYVFDWAWADAYDRQLASGAGGYYPKLVSAVPFSPIPGPRLLTAPGLTAAEQRAIQLRLLNDIAQAVESEKWSSAHLLFLNETDVATARAAGWLVRQGVQFHWQNRSDQPYRDFDDFLGSLQRDKRKKIKQERRKVEEAGVRFRILEGSDIEGSDWAFFDRCYQQTYLERGQAPYLSTDFWMTVGESMPLSWVMVQALDNETPIASALLAVDRDNRVAYGRYWGALRTVSCLHFEACYYQPLEWCIAHGFQSFEGGAQGEHKLARGLTPVTTYSAHWIRHEGFRDAVARFLQREEIGIAGYINELDERAPFRNAQ